MTATETLSALLSVLALLSSLGVWALQRRREGPRLETWWGGDKVEWPYCGYAAENEHLARVQFEATLLIANLSTLPDALLDVRLDPFAECLGSANADAIEVTGTARDAQPRTGGNDVRPFDASSAYRVSQPHVAIRGGAEILNGCEPGGQRRPCVRRRTPCERQVHVRVDQPGKQGQRGQIDRRCTGWRRGARSRTRIDDPRP